VPACQERGMCAPSVEAELCLVVPILELFFSVLEFDFPELA
jgi:hypothetical protein